MLRRLGAFVLFFLCTTVFLFPDLFASSTISRNLVSFFWKYLDQYSFQTENSKKCGPSKAEFFFEMCRSNSRPLGPIDSRVCSRRRL